MFNACNTNMSRKVILIIKTVLIVVSTLSETKAQLEEKVTCGGIYLPENCEDASVETLKTVEDYERCAPARLSPFNRDYVWGGSGKQTTLYGNKEAFSRIWIRKRVLQGNANYSLSTTVFGRKIEFPLGISPVVGQTLFHPDGERGTARAAATAGAIMVLNGFSLTSVEDVAAAVPPNTELWIQVYVHPKRELTLQLLQRAERAGFKAVVVTVDEPTDTNIRCESRSIFFDRYINSKCSNYLYASGKDLLIDATLTFDVITWLAGVTDLPIVVKGSLTAEDSIEAIKAGASAIYVSNQGGRELEGSLPTIDALPAIVKAVKSQYPWVDVYLDSGIRSGYDIFKALARGAKAVFIGRPTIWGLAMEGEKGVEAVLSILKEEFRQAMLHAGFSNPSLISPSSIISQWIYSDYH